MNDVNKFKPTVEIKNRLRPLYEKDNWHWVVGLSLDLGVITLAVILSLQSPYFYLLTVLLVGSRQRAIASLLHEAAHMTLMSNKVLCRVIGEYLLAYPIFQNYEAYRHSHVKMHHHHLGDQLTDPDHRYYIESGLYAASDRLDFLLRHLLKSITLANTSHYFIYLVKNRAGDIITKPWQGFKLLLVHLAILAVFWFSVGPLGYLLFWLVPYFTSFQVIGWFSEISEHFGMFGVYQDEVKLTRNRFPSLIERLFIGMHGDNYHLTHHLYAGIPYWNLRKAHLILMDDPKYAEANHGCGGIFTAKGDARSSLGQIFEAYRSGRISAVIGTE
ncbi:guanitoxin biosynthesis L-arginine gamma (S) hydroxylase [Pseudomonas delhiensis]|uniref:guanitoxin biosynthesis L-arginine gamma (S) hydroxylase n=1 Tax=Pseudomonas delhiensis TaxID=366289 RepID=UPI003159E5A2